MHIGAAVMCLKCQNRWGRPSGRIQMGFRKDSYHVRCLQASGTFEKDKCVILPRLMAIQKPSGRIQKSFWVSGTFEKGKCVILPRYADQMAIQKPSG